jgi:hypothetical protein
MRIIRNKTQRPLKISLDGGRFLHLGPGQTGQVANPAAERPSLRKLVDAGEVEFVDEPSGGEGRSAPSSTVRESTQGHRQGKALKPKGNRGG